ncbi:YncE family protein [Couchioplanes caeruleus]|uniref:Surface layer protein n=2 Tax=Couchioplanes caeruleus TaxID=56438 RepID=A0A1K0FQF0_9ACTN|nr:YncE family protein [Couchioplanes caeruleus]OJF15009.1 surface layer protein [Couchioplanes caeruleus subsp. caeruleus]ROP28918.1 YVTN family beta-propeller protein [Couchioplanes caeruleus]
MSDYDLPPHVRAEIASASRDARLLGVGELAQLAMSADLAVAAAARLALRHLTDDDSRSVAAAAAAALGRTAVRITPDRVDFGQVSPETPLLVSEVLVDGPPLAVAAATVTAAGPGLHATLAGHRLRIEWRPASDWLDGSVTVRGPAGWADVRVTGQVDATGPAPVAATAPTLEERLAAEAGVGALPATRVTVLPPPARRRAGGTLLIAGLTALVLLGGAGVAVALTTGLPGDRAPVAAPLPAATPGPLTTAASDPATAAPAPAAVARQPLALRAASVAKPTAVGTIRVGAEPEGVAVSPDGRTVYVANQNSRILSVVDAATRRATSVRLRNTPRFVTTSRDGGLVFVSMYEKDMSGSGVAVVDAASRRVVRYLATGVQPFTLAVGPDDRLWVPIHSSGRVEMYATGGTQRADGRMAVPPNPHAVAFSPVLRRAFTANHESNAVAVIDMPTSRVLRSVPVSRAPHSVAVSPDGARVLVAGYEAGTADLIDARTLRRTGPLRVGDKPQAVAFAGDGGHAYVVNEGDNSVTVLDASTGAATATVGVGRSPRAIAVAPDGRLAYVSNGDDDTITILRIGE